MATVGGHAGGVVEEAEGHWWRRLLLAVMLTGCRGGGRGARVVPAAVGGHADGATEEANEYMWCRTLLAATLTVPLRRPMGHVAGGGCDA